MKRTTLPCHPEELAKLAAAVSNRKTPAQAVAYALELWRESEAALERAAVEAGGVAESVGINLDATLERILTLQRHDETVPKPAKFPATLADFFKVIVRAKTPADCTKRLRAFLCHTFQNSGSRHKATETDAITLAANHLQEIKDGDKQGGYFREHHWLSFGGSYLDWWSREKSVKARESALQRKRKRT